MCCKKKKVQKAFKWAQPRSFTIIDVLRQSMGLSLHTCTTPQALHKVCLFK